MKFLFYKNLVGITLLIILLGDVLGICNGRDYISCSLQIPKTSIDRVIKMVIFKGYFVQYKYFLSGIPRHIMRDGSLKNE